MSVKGKVRILWMDKELIVMIIEVRLWMGKVKLLWMDSKVRSHKSIEVR